jgi:4-hydroxybenzoate polyprenyltransferase
MSTVKNYLSLIKFSHTIFAMPFALIGFFLAITNFGLHHLIFTSFSGTQYEWFVFREMDNTGSIGGISFRNLPLSSQALIIRFLLIVLCMVFARSAAMAFNRYLDRDIDALNPRTAIREVPKGIITPRHALAFTVVNCVLFVITTFFINRICFFLSPIALTVVLGYSYTKRFTPLCHLILGLGLSLAPIGAYLAVTGVFHWLPILFSFAVIFWVSGFDIIYSLQDEEFDKSQQLYSIPAAVGKEKALRISEILHLLSAACIVAAGRWGGFGWLYWIGVLVFGGMLIYQHSIVKPHDLRRVNIAFMTANGIASVVFAVFVIADLFTK